MWAALGAYICKHLKAGKGIFIPRLGTFTFTSTDVDLAGTTNQLVRDKQHRLPVFQIAKDFTPGTHISQGISNNKG